MCGTVSVVGTKLQEFLPWHNPMLQRRGGVGSKNDRRAGTHFFEPGGYKYKIEPLLTKMVNKVNNDI